MDRIASLRAFVAQQPEQPFPRYALALEHRKLGQLEEARAQLDEVMERFPDYVPAYLMAGGVLADLGRRDQAAEVYRRGVDAARRAGDGHARSELEGALAGLGESE